MEIRIENGKATVIEATKAELKSLVEFMYGEEIIPYNTVKEIEVEIPTEVASETETPAEESRIEEVIEQTENKLLTMKELCKEVDLSSTTIRWHMNKGMAHKFINGKYFFDKDECLKYLTKHMKPQNKHFGARHNKIKSSTNSYSNWHKTQLAKVREKHLDTGKTFNKVYVRMNRDYGIVWEQLKHEFFVAKGTMPKSTIEMVYWMQYERENGNENFNQLFESVLDNVLNNVA